MSCPSNKKPTHQSTSQHTVIGEQHTHTNLATGSTKYCQPASWPNQSTVVLFALLWQSIHKLWFGKYQPTKFHHFLPYKTSPKHIIPNTVPMLFWHLSWLKAFQVWSLSWNHFWRGLRKCLDSSSAFQLEITFNTCVSTYCSRSWAISLSRTIFTKLALPRRYTVNLKLKIVAQAGKSTSTFSISGGVQSGQTPAAISVAQDLIYWRVHRVWGQYYHIRLLKRCQGYNCTMYFFCNSTFVCEHKPIVDVVMQPI